MTFYVYDPEGHKTPYLPGEDWHSVKRKDLGDGIEKFRKEKNQVDSQEGKKGLPSIFDREYNADKEKNKEGNRLVASQIMTQNPKTLSPRNTLNQAWKVIDKYHFRHVPIVSKKTGRLVGIISDRLLTHEMLDHGERVTHKRDRRHIKDIMIRNVLTASPNTSISEIARIFVEERIGSMPVLNEQGKIVGILTRSDILRTLVTVLPPQFRA